MGVISTGRRQGSRLVAVLGPTNTGKTYLAIERMLGFRTGMIGFPLRLLARENYDRVRSIKGEGAVALVTGEEKIVPPKPAYFVCTVESMPLDREVAFLAVDEIQLCADRERGHVFTDRLLRARGADETMFLGSDTARRLIRRLVPGVEFITRPRFSGLAYTGQKKITRLPPRSAAVAFSAADVYAIAELVRRQRGGAAVVLGALSPRARNAQVALYEAGEVDYMVATDAIGMGLNMDICHVAFAALRKFDGRGPRPLSAPELAQIAGRAGRYMNDGTFGTTAGVGPLDAGIVDSIENHRFPPLRKIYWRNPELAFNTTGTLIKRLEMPPPMPELLRKRDADDHLALLTLARDPEIASLAGTSQAVKLLWEVCQIPDFRKELSESHARLLARIYKMLMGKDGLLPEDWIGPQIARLDRCDGDIDTLVSRIDYIRTWTFISHRDDWLGDAGHWQERTRAIEDKLSDALHERLTQRFVDRRTAILVKRLKDKEELFAAVRRTGEVLMEGHFVGRLEGFRFVADDTEADAGGRVILNAANRALRGEIAVRLQDLRNDDAPAFTLKADGRLAWRSVAIARLVRGKEMLVPKVSVPANELLTGEQTAAIVRRLEAWLEGEIERCLPDLFRAREALASQQLSGPVRGLLYQLVEALGALPRRQAAAQIAALDPADRKTLARYGARLGVETVFIPALLEPPAVRMRALLWAVQANGALGSGDGARWPEPPAGRLSAPRDETVPDGFYQAVGYLPLGTCVLRADRVEVLAAEARKLARQGPFVPTRSLARRAGLELADLPGVLTGLGFQASEDAGGLSFAPRRRAPGKRWRKPRAGTRQGRGGKARSGKARGAGADSPFAKLGELDLTS
ncbi:MAG: helicase-related protein [Alphaproteobacteria bacterium]|nr:helicase-related protein [Alphaproteobacteria bacterium]